MSVDKNIISLIAAKIAAFLFYEIMSNLNDKNFIPFPILTRILSHSRQTKYGKNAVLITQ
ncbi:hypothetical protein VK70_15535 [Paenibacillus durus ATCC 35681]|uniref:Uncharacterized protein n=1 Tax=Paenibacillus durus ATCC 35681 TaxID=1333534 RepID=A0A0F7FAS6_PAEDU|nr:hypothetical protein VK70_15535 [Paenibacillus durus ATCC 35681]